MLKLYLITLGSIFGFCLLVWFWYLINKISSVIDVAWSLGILIAGSIYLYFSEQNMRHIIIFGLLVAWSFRLALYIYWTRVRIKQQDVRYDNISSNWSNKTFSFLWHYFFQGFLMSLIAVPFYFIAQQTYETFQILDYVAIGLFAFALLFETLADFQLSRYKKNKSDTSKVCEVGLWKYSRHPNYFFEWLIWVSFALFAWNTHLGYLAILSPLCLLIIVTLVTGPITERASLKSRGEAYEAYQKRTSYFIPWFRKKDK